MLQMVVSTAIEGRQTCGAGAEVDIPAGTMGMYVGSRGSSSSPLLSVSMGMGCDRIPGRFPRPLQGCTHPSS